MDGSEGRSARNSRQRRCACARSGEREEKASPQAQLGLEVADRQSRCRGARRSKRCGQRNATASFDRVRNEDVLEDLEAVQIIVNALVRPKAEGRGVEFLDGQVPPGIKGRRH
jgi:hypothetical protein